MNLRDCVDFANQHPIAYLATEDGDQPRVRALLMLFADETGFYFVTFTPKAMARQLKENPNVEVCFFNNPPALPEAKQLRVTGRAEFVQDPAIKQKGVEARLFLEPIVGRPIAPIVEVFRVGHGEAHFWTIPDVLKESQLERVRF